MEDLRTEEEQIAALKRWWAENGNALLIGIGAALAIVFGWKAYQNSVEQQKAEASMMYQQLISTATANSFEEKEEASTVSFLANELKERFDDTEYGIYAALFLAKEAVSAGALESAQAELQWVLDNTDDMRLHHIVKARLARVMSAQGEHQAALDLLSTDDPAFKANYLEVAGDIKMRMGDPAGAEKDYLEAYKLVKDSPQKQPLLTVKLSDMGINPETL